MLETTSMNGGDEDPLSHKISMPHWRWARTAVLALTLAPLRVALLAATYLLCWALSSIGLWGLSDEELNAQPLDLWRARLKAAVRVLGRLTLRSEIILAARLFYIL